MTLELIPESERIIRYNDKRGALCSAAKLFYAYVRGLEQFSGKKVLEIGGVDHNHNLANYFLEMGAEYHAVGLEENKAQKQYVLPIRDFRGVQTLNFYDLIISYGVFEEHGIDQSKDGGDWRSFVL